jgi:alpha-tubulin suppressor-like RCC1 family protein
LGRKFVRGQKKYSALPLMIDLDDVVRKSGLAIRQVACGGLFTAVVTESGQVYMWGDGRRGELGHMQDPSLKQTPRLVDALQNVFVTKVACGSGHTVAIADTGRVYIWGWNKYGQTGHNGRPTGHKSFLLEHASARDIVDAACGNKHTVLLNKHGEVFTFGCGGQGQLGHGDGTDRPFPTKVEALADVPIVSVACGAVHTCFVDANGEVYLCGFGEHFHANEDQHFWYVPKKLSLPEPIKQIACGQSHNVALSVKGNVYCWGSGDYGQIGFGIKSSTATPRLVLDSGDIAQIAAGRYHSFALSSSGVLWSWGCGETGQLGQNGDEYAYLPKVVSPILGTVVGQVACGEYHTAVLTSAPWARLSHDVSEMHFSARQELAMKEELVRKTHHGLARKDLAKIHEDMKVWEVGATEQRAQLLAAEKEALEREIAGIQYTGSLQESVLDRIEDLDRLEEFARTGALAPSLRTLDRTQKLAEASRTQKPGQLVERAEGAEADGLLLRDHPAFDGTVAEVGNGALADTESYAAALAAASAIPRDLDPLSLNHPALRLPSVPGAQQQSQQQQQQSGPSGAQTARLPSSGVVLPPIGQGKKKSLAVAGPLTSRGPVSSAALQATQASSPGAPLAYVGQNGKVLSTQQMRAQFLKETAAMAKDMAGTVHDNSESAQARQLQRILREVFEARREYDMLRGEGDSRTEQLQVLTRELELLQQQERGVREAHEISTTRLKEIDMKLNTVTIKITETEENKHNYQTNIVHLKEEDFDNFNQLKALRKTSQDNQNFFRKMNDIKDSAIQEREKAHAELLEFRQEVKAYQQFVANQFSQFEDIIHVIRTQNSKRERQRESQAVKVRAKVDARLKKLHEEAQNAEGRSQELGAQLMALDLKLRHYEDSFTKIAAATGLSDPDAIVNKYFFKGEIKEQLQQEIVEKEHQREELERLSETLSQQLDAARANHKDETWREVDTAAENYRSSEHHYTKAQAQAEKLAQRLAFVQEGILALARSVATATMSMSSHDGSLDAVLSGHGGEADSTTFAAAASMGAVSSHAVVAGHRSSDAAAGADTLEDSSLWNPLTAERVLERIHLDMDALLEAEKEYLARVQSDTGRDDRRSLPFTSKWGPTGSVAPVAAPAVSSYESALANAPTQAYNAQPAAASVPEPVTVPATVPESQAASTHAHTHAAASAAAPAPAPAFEEPAAPAPAPEAPAAAAESSAPAPAQAPVAAPAAAAPIAAPPAASYEAAAAPVASAVTSAPA